QPFGLVISDWNMPGMTGVDLLRTMRSFGNTRELPFLMITGEDEHLAEAMNAGATDFVVKPFNVEQLSEKIGSFFGETGERSEKHSCSSRKNGACAQIFVPSNRLCLTQSRSFRTVLWFGCEFQFRGALALL